MLLNAHGNLFMQARSPDLCLQRKARSEVNLYCYSKLRTNIIAAWGTIAAVHVAELHVQSISCDKALCFSATLLPMRRACIPNLALMMQLPKPSPCVAVAGSLSNSVDSFRVCN